MDRSRYDNDLLPPVRSRIDATGHGRMLDGTSGRVLDRRSPLDDAGGRDGPALGRVFDGDQHRRAQSAEGIRAESSIGPLWPLKPA